MPISRPCSFCGNTIEPGTGKMFVRRDGTVFYFCSNKCNKNMLALKRVPRDVEWTVAYASAKGKIAAPAAAVVTGPAAEAEVSLDFEIRVPKGKDLPDIVVTLVDRRLGPNLSAAAIGKHFIAFSKTDGLKSAVAEWYAKKSKKAFTEVSSAEYDAFMSTARGKKLLRDWLDAEAKKGK
jgi:large subunit ribosomal protein L24e